MIYPETASPYEDAGASEYAREAHVYMKGEGVVLFPTKEEAMKRANFWLREWFAIEMDDCAEVAQMLKLADAALTVKEEFGILRNFNMLMSGEDFEGPYLNILPAYRMKPEWAIEK